MTHETVREYLTVYADIAGGASAFNEANLDPVAVAQGYSLSVTGETEDLTVQDLADALATVWANPEVVKKSFVLSADSLVLRPNAVSGNVDATNKITDQDIKLAVGSVVWVAIMDSNATTGDKYVYGKAVITGFEQSGTVGEFATYSVTFEGKGELLEGTKL